MSKAQKSSAVELKVEEEGQFQVLYKFVSGQFQVLNNAIKGYFQALTNVIQG